jgi:hypothetical protein
MIRREFITLLGGAAGGLDQGQEPGRTGGDDQDLAGSGWIGCALMKRRRSTWK